MGQLSVWAPNPREVSLNIGETVVAMSRGRHGWWHAESPLAVHGADYAFLLDGRGPLPDPRSLWQPAGVHGPSRIFDHSTFRWGDDGWAPPPLESAIFYELHVGTFSREGTFDGAARHLGHLADLGISHVELMPVNGFSGSRGWGYDGVNLFAPHGPYGGPVGLKALVDACHQHGLAVVLDVVYNHLGPEGNYLEDFGPYLTDRYASPWGKAVNFDGPDSDEVRRFFCDNALMWLRDYHVDGLRIDAVHAIVDTSAVHILEQLAREVEALASEVGKAFVLIAESDLNDPRVINPREVGGYGLDAQWNDDFHHSLHAVLTGENAGYYADFGSFADLAQALTKGFVYDGRYSSYRRRSHGRPAAGLPGHKFVGYLQNHDHVGNRAKGDRATHLMSPDLLKAGAALVLTAPFLPMLFQGEEWGASTPFQYFTDHQDFRMAEFVRRGRREEFSAFDWDPEEIPDPQDPGTFLRSRLDWGEQEREPHRSIHDWYRQLIRLRRQTPALNDGRMENVFVEFDEAERWIVVGRGDVTVACNLSKEGRWIALPPRQAGPVLLASKADVQTAGERLFLPAESAAVLNGRTKPLGLGGRRT